MVTGGSILEVHCAVVEGLRELGFLARAFEGRIDQHENIAIGWRLRLGIDMVLSAFVDGGFLFVGDPVSRYELQRFDLSDPEFFRNVGCFLRAEACEGVDFSDGYRDERFWIGNMVIENLAGAVGVRGGVWFIDPVPFSFVEIRGRGGRIRKS